MDDPMALAQGKTDLSLTKKIERSADAVSMIEQIKRLRTVGFAVSDVQTLGGDRVNVTFADLECNRGYPPARR
jgi:hypothetical protein